MSSKILNFFEIDSTSLEARRMIDLNSMQNNIIISAKIQTQGRGRLDRAWISLEGNLMFSIVIPESWVKNFNTLPACIGVAICNEITPNEQIKFKWPNDLIIIEDGLPRKFGGILIERYSGYFIIGIGINVAYFPSKDTIFPATNLLKHGIKISSEEKINENLLTMLNGDQQDVLTKWKMRHYFHGKNVKINGIDGVFKDIDENFNAILDSVEIQNGTSDTNRVINTRHIITFGDVS